MLCKVVALIENIFWYYVTKLKIVPIIDLEYFRLNVQFVQDVSQNIMCTCADHFQNSYDTKDNENV